ncbi:MAG: hypothetical protein IPO09_09845 [Anaeromyxobacter sp.]|nr:hypothetical protein [Anaeromyxobacter sp.]MBL0278586.1 hypothetical protein [Anaeromyxobacter sp.]
MIRRSPAVPVARSPRLTRAGPLAVLASALLVAAACGSSKDTPEITPITGTFDVTSIDCNGMAAGVPADLTARIVSGRSYTFAFNADGSRMTVALADPSCTWGISHNVAYNSDTRFSVTEVGSFACAPSAAACAALIAVENPGDLDICGKVASTFSTALDHGTVPQSTGGTMILSLVGDTACSQNGGTNPLRFVLTRR